ncbi:hypothetical protein ACJJIL_07970 [Microbulbifer sp. EKSA005]|uniref:hypothetical protein n=1 Tax=Microbulbifer sp. EKSA005 TaxID=3243364 RepID=UPI00404391BE
MKVYSFCEGVYVHCHPEKKDTLYLAAGVGGNFKLKNGEVTYEEYLSDDQRFNFYQIAGSVYRRYLVSDRALFLNGSGGELNLPQEFLDVIFPAYPLVGEVNRFPATILNYPKKFKNSLAVFDVDSRNFVSKEVRSISDVLIDNFLYGYDVKAEHFFKYDLNLNEVWIYKQDFPSESALQPILIEGTIVTFIGPQVESRQQVEGRSHYAFSGGLLVGINDEDGSVVWEREMPNAVDIYQLVGVVLYVVSLKEILLINAVSGELINRIDTETTVPLNRRWGPFIYIDDSYIYYSHFDDRVILIYDIDSLTLQRRIDLPEGYYVRGHDFHDRASGKQYFSLVTHTQYVAQGPVLEVDPQHLDEVLEFESKLDMDIKLDYSPDNTAEKELVIRIACESLDDTLRFGEIYTRDEAQRYSFNYMEMRFQDRPFTPEPSFNGIIRFQYSGCSQSKELVEEHLSVMEKRFSKWAEDRGFYSCTDKNQLTQLKAEYVA